MKNQVFYDLIWRDDCKRIFRDLGWKNPRVPQSMYICKNAKLGSAVEAHRDATFLYNPSNDDIGNLKTIRHFDDSLTQPSGELFSNPQYSCLR